MYFILLSMFVGVTSGSSSTPGYMHHGSHGKGVSGGPTHQGGPGGPPPRPPGPPFLKGLSQAEQCEFLTIFRKENETIAQKKQDIEAWAGKYNLTAQVDKFETDLKSKQAELAQNVSDLISALPAVQTQMADVYKNNSQTEKQIHDAIQKIIASNPKEIAALFFIESLFKEHHPVGGPGGKPPGGKGAGPPHPGGPMPYPGGTPPPMAGGKPKGKGVWPPSKPFPHDEC